MLGKFRDNLHEQLNTVKLYSSQEDEKLNYMVKFVYYKYNESLYNTRFHYIENIRNKRSVIVNLNGNTLSWEQRSFQRNYISISEMVMMCTYLIW